MALAAAANAAANAAADAATGGDGRSSGPVVPVGGAGASGDETDVSDGVARGGFEEEEAGAAALSSLCPAPPMDYDAEAGGAVAGCGVVVASQRPSSAAATRIGLAPVHARVSAEHMSGERLERAASATTTRASAAPVGISGQPARVALELGDSPEPPPEPPPGPPPELPPSQPPSQPPRSHLRRRHRSCKAASASSAAASGVLTTPRACCATSITTTATRKRRRRKRARRPTPCSRRRGRGTCCLRSSRPWSSCCRHAAHPRARGGARGQAAAEEHRYAARGETRQPSKICRARRTLPTTRASRPSRPQSRPQPRPQSRPSRPQSRRGEPRAARRPRTPVPSDACSPAPPCIAACARARMVHPLPQMSQVLPPVTDGPADPRCGAGLLSASLPAVLGRDSGPRGRSRAAPLSTDGADSADGAYARARLSPRAGAVSQRPPRHAASAGQRDAFPLSGPYPECERAAAAAQPHRARACLDEALDQQPQICDVLSWQRVT